MLFKSLDIPSVVGSLYFWVAISLSLCNGYFPACEHPPHCLFAHRFPFIALHILSPSMLDSTSVPSPFPLLPCPSRRLFLPPSLLCLSSFLFPEQSCLMSGLERCLFCPVWAGDIWSSLLVLLTRHVNCGQTWIYLFLLLNQFSVAFSHGGLRSLLYFFVLLFGNLRLIFTFSLSMLVLLPKEMVKLRGKDFLFISLVAPKDGVAQWVNVGSSLNSFRQQLTFYVINVLCTAPEGEGLISWAQKQGFREWGPN